MSVLADALEAGQSGSPPGADPSVAIDGPQPPVAPEVITRDEATGKATVRAVRLTAPLRVDGRLDEAIYETTQAISDFIQVEPSAGERETEKTEIWLFFDERNLYVSIRCWESNPERMIANEMRRDSANIYPERVRRHSSSTRSTTGATPCCSPSTPLGGRSDGQITNEQSVQRDWNPVWDVKVGRFEGGWTFEAAIPFKSLRYRPGRTQIWGFNVERVQQVEERGVVLTRIPKRSAGRRAFLQVVARRRRSSGSRCRRGR